MKNLQGISLKISLLIIVVLLFDVNHINAQNKAYKANAIYGSLGTTIFSNQASISYERMIFQNNKWRTKAKVNFGHYLSNNADFDTNAIVYRNHLSLSAVQMIELFEINVGAAYTQYNLARGFEPEPDVDYSEIKERIDFYGSIGIRYVKNKFLIRVGLGNLELLYLGMGVNF